MLQRLRTDRTSATPAWQTDLDDLDRKFEEQIKEKFDKMWQDTQDKVGLLSHIASRTMADQHAKLKEQFEAKMAEQQAKIAKLEFKVEQLSTRLGEIQGVSMPLDQDTVGQSHSQDTQSSEASRELECSPPDDQPPHTPSDPAQIDSKITSTSPNSEAFAEKPKVNGIVTKTLPPIPLDEGLQTTSTPSTSSTTSAAQNNHGEVADAASPVDPPAV